MYFGFLCAQANHPSALENFDRVLESAKGKPVFVFLDYDGTLSPIVEDPECAFMSDEVCSSILLVDAFLIILTQSRCFFPLTTPCIVLNGSSDAFSSKRDRKLVSNSHHYGTK